MRIQDPEKSTAAEVSDGDGGQSEGTSIATLARPHADAAIERRAVNEEWIEPALLPPERSKRVFDNLYLLGNGKSPTNNGATVPDKLVLSSLVALARSDSRARDRLLRLRQGAANQTANVGSVTNFNGPVNILEYGELPPMTKEVEQVIEVKVETADDGSTIEYDVP